MKYVIDLVFKDNKKPIVVTDVVSWSVDLKGYLRLENKECGISFINLDCLEQFYVKEIDG